MLSRGDVQHRQGAGVEGVVLGRIDVADVADVGGHGLVAPAVAADQEAPLGQAVGGVQEEPLHPRLTVGQAVAQERQVGLKPRLGRHGVVGGGVQGVVDRRAGARSEALVGLDHRAAAAVGEHPVEARQQPADGVVVARRAHLVQGGGGVHVPEHGGGVGRGVVQHALQQEVVEHPHPAGLDHHVGLARLRQHLAGGALGGGIDHRAGVGGRVDVAVLLPVVGVGLVEGDVPAAPMQLAQHAAVVGGRPVPIGRDQRRAVKGQLHGATVSV